MVKESAENQDDNFPEDDIRPRAVMFTDMADSTAYAQKHESEAAAARQCRHNDMLIPLVLEEQGTLIRTYGDALLVVFDHAIDAARCAVKMLRRLYEINEAADAARREDGIHIRIGFHWGKAGVYRSWGQLDLEGAAGNVAARVRDGNSKEPDQILLSEAAVEQLRPYKAELDVEDFAVNTAAGIGPLHLYRLAWQPGHVSAEAPARLSADSYAGFPNPMEESDHTRGVHCAFIDPSSGSGHIRPVFVRAVASEVGDIRPRVECDELMKAAVTRAADAAFSVLRRFGFRGAGMERHLIEWWINGPTAQYAGASIGLGAALAVAAAHAEVSIDRETLAIGTIAGERVGSVQGMAEKWTAICKKDYKTVLLATADADSVLRSQAESSGVKLIPVDTVEDAIVEALGPALGLPSRRLAESVSEASGTGQPIQIDLVAEPAASAAPQEPRGGANHRSWHGERFRIVVRVDQDCHLSLLNISSEGRVTILVPNADQPAVRVTAGQWTPIPEAEEEFNRTLKGSSGIGRLVAVASDAPLELRPQDFDQSGRFAEPLIRTRGAAQVRRNLKEGVRGRAEFSINAEPYAAGVPSRQIKTRGAARGRQAASEFRCVDLG